MTGRTASFGILATVCLLLASVPVALAQGAVQVSTAPYDGAQVTTEEHPVLDEAGTEVGSKAWRVVNGTGNCCENYLASTHEGRLLNFGGTYIRFSDDFGRTWRTVETPVPYSGGEGAIAAGPGGDVIGVGWTPYNGDQLWAHRYDASEGTWYYQPVPNHKPFYDRPWITVLPGPFDRADGEASFVSLVMGGLPKRPMLMSTDGLTYAEASWETASTVGDADGLEAVPDPANDWVQPHVEANVASIGSGWGTSSSAGGLDCGDRAVFTPQTQWACSDANLGSGYVFSDAAGTLHRVSMGSSGFTYASSPDGPGNWLEREVELPGDLTVEEWDAAAQARSDQAAIAIHAYNESAEADVDLVYRFDHVNCDPSLDEVLQVGRGDLLLSSGVTSQISRFDFSSVAILPGGRLAVSFADSYHHDGPGVAIETGSFPDSVEPRVVEGGCAPDAGFQAVPTPVATGATVEFDAAESADPDGSIEAYRWSFGDGANATGVRVEHTYEAAGTYNVTLTVVDDAGREATAREEIRVLDPGALEENRQQNAPPNARFSLRGEGLTLEVDASNSTDPDGSIATYRWSWGDNNTGLGETATHTYAEPGTYEVALTIEDTGGATSRASTEVTLQESGAPQTADDGSPVPGPGLAVLLVAAGLAACAWRGRGRER